MSDIINHPVLVVVSTSERADRCLARLLCMGGYVCGGEEGWKGGGGKRGGGVRRGRPPRRAVEIPISIIESQSIARTPRGAKHVPRAPGFFSTAFRGLLSLVLAAWMRGILILRRDTRACYRYIWSRDAIIVRRRNQGIGIIVFLIGESCVQYAIILVN